MHCFYIKPADLGDLRNEKRLICTIGNVSFHCALNKNKLGEFYVYIGKEKLKKLSLEEGMVVKPKFKRDTTEHQFEFPDELKEVFKFDPEAKKVFDKLSEGAKRAIIYIVGRMKSQDKRIEKALLIGEKLRNGITSPRLIIKK